MMPPILKENTVNLFSYWSNGIQQGMRYEGELYGLLESFPFVGRSQAYQKACHLCDRGVKTCITRSESSYRVWVNLKHLAANPQPDTHPVQPRLLERKPQLVLSSC